MAAGARALPCLACAGAAASVPGCLPGLAAEGGRASACGAMDGSSTPLSACSTHAPPCVTLPAAHRVSLERDLAGPPMEAWYARVARACAMAVVTVAGGRPCQVWQEGQSQ